MKLLIVTQKVDRHDTNLGFFHRWIHEFSRHYEHVTVICLNKGEYELPLNVEVISLGKDEGKGKLMYVARFFSYIWKYRGSYDEVFVHMNPEYVVLGGLLWKMWKKKVGLWYIHRKVNIKLRIAALFATVIFSSSPESFRIKTKKVKFVKHGIDFSKFTADFRAPLGEISILHVGRITPIKNCDILIEATHILKQKWNKNINVIFIGKPVYSLDFEYEKRLKDLIEKYSLQRNVKFAGGVAYNELPNHFAKAHMSVNLAPSGGMDKVVLESLASNRPVFVSNEAFSDLFGEYRDIFMFKERNAEELAEKIMKFYERPDTEKITEILHKTVKEAFDLERLILYISSILHETSR